MHLSCQVQVCPAVSLQVQHLRQTLTPVTASIGLACFPDDAAQAGELLRLAGAALYRAKHEGRNRVVVS
jgi:diguanylate cyclase (GGDEF)-like protein